MAEHALDPQDKFYFYNSCFNPIRLLKKYAVPELKGMPGYLTNAFGVRIKLEHLPDVLKGRAGEVESLPIPANWHSDVAEFGAAFRGLGFSQDSFTMIELGCGWGCWMNILGTVAKRSGRMVKLFGIEGDAGHIGFADEALRVNGFDPREYTLFHGIAAAKSGWALFPTQEQSGVSWGLAPIFDAGADETRRLVDSGRYRRLEQIPLARLCDGLARIDLLHVDIQGGEEFLLPGCVSFLTEKVAYLVVGTHSRQVEGLLFDCMLKAGWVLEMERPAVLSLCEHPVVVVDGVQGWRNPRILNNDAVDVADLAGAIEIDLDHGEIRAGQELLMSVTVTNSSGTDWASRGLHPVHIAYHWFDENGATAVFEGQRTPFAQVDLFAGAATTQTIRVVGPATAGRYRLRVTLVQEGIRWFDDSVFKCAEQDIIVVD